MPFKGDKMSKLNVIDKEKIKHSRLKRGALAMAVLTVLNLSGCSDLNNVQATSIEEQVDDTRVFKPGEHTIAISVLGNIYQGHFQAPYLEGYSCIGIGNCRLDSVICLYQNTEEVLCTTDVFREDKTPIFSSFGIPTSKKLVK